MIHSIKGRYSAAVLLWLLVGTGCSSGDGSSVGPNDVYLDEWVITVVFEGTATRPVRDGTWEFTVDEVLFEQNMIVNPEGLTAEFTSRQPGDAINVVTSEAKLEPGRNYVVAGSQILLGSPETAEEAAFGLFDATTMAPMRPVLPDPRAIAPPEATPEVLKATLVTYIEEAARYQEAVRRGLPSPPVGDVLARAWDLRGFSPTATPPDRAQAELDAFLALPAEERQLEPFGDIPEGAADALNLRDFEALVIWRPGEIDSIHDALGFKTDAGYVGPQLLLPGRGFTEVIGSVPRSGRIELVGWQVPTESPFQFAGAVPIPMPTTVEVADGGEVLLVDFVTGRVGWISYGDAQERIEGLLTVEK